MPNETLERWGETATRYVRHDRDAKTISIGIDEDKLTLGPIEDATRAKAMWADGQSIVARLLETGAETVERNYERTKDLLLAGERIVGFLRGVIQNEKYVARSITLDLCLAAYDVAKRRASAPSAFQRLRDRDALDREPTPEPAPGKKLHEQPPIPEPETELLYQVLYHWKKRHHSLDEELHRVREAYMATNPDPQEPCPADLARAYTSVFKAATVVQYLEGAIHEQLGEHLATVMPDGSGDFPTEIRFQVKMGILAVPPTPLTTQPMTGFEVTAEPAEVAPVEAL